MYLKPFHAKRFLTQCEKYWNDFYKRNGDHFFKDRHWTCREFTELANPKCVLFELGCGVGNFLFPYLQDNPTAYVFACDLSEKAIEILKSNAQYCEEKCHAFQCDLSAENASAAVLQNISSASVDMATAFFFLSAIPPEKLQIVVECIIGVLKVGGLVLVRDYATGDLAQIRFESANEPKKVAHNVYVRQDGTISHFLNIDLLTSIFTCDKFELVDSRLIEKSIMNRKLGINMERRFIQAVFRKR